MKIMIAISLLILYTSSAFGIAVNFHYCDNHISKISVLNFGGHPGCNCNPHGGPMSCCKDVVNCCLSDKHDVVQPVIVSDLSFFIALPPSEKRGPTCSLPPTCRYPVYIARDLRSCSQPLFILHNVLRV